MSNAYLPLPDWTSVEPRYTTVADVKLAMGIDSDSYDLEIKQAIISIEILIDAHLNTSFPQSADPNAGTDAGLDPPPIEVVPVVVSQAAEVGAIKTFQLTQAPTGGSDDLIGTYDFGNASRTAFNAVTPLLLGLKRGWGIA